MPCDTQEAIFREQPQLLKALLGLIQPPPPPTTAAAAVAASSVKPGRPARALIARIIILVLTRGDQKSLYDVAQSLLRGVNGSETKGAPEREKEWRIACTFVLGEVYAVFGSQVSPASPSYLSTPLNPFACTGHELVHRHCDDDDAHLPLHVLCEFRWCASLPAVS